jgi:hypothetical protein
MYQQVIPVTPAEWAICSTVWQSSSTTKHKERNMTSIQTSQQIRSNVTKLAPVDYLIVEFPVGHTDFTGRILEELHELAHEDTISVLYMRVITKRTDGGIDIIEADATNIVDSIRAMEINLAEVLAADDVYSLTSSMAPGSTAGLLVWENTWASALASAVQASQGHLITRGRVPVQALASALKSELISGRN